MNASLAPNTSLSAAKLPLSVITLDNDPSQQAAYKRYFVHWEPAVYLRQFTQGFEALAALSTNPADVLILEVMLPGIDGYQVMRTLCEREQFDHMRIVIASQVPQQALKPWGNWLARARYLPKPVSLKDLQQALANDAVTHDDIATCLSWQWAGS